MLVLTRKSRQRIVVQHAGERMVIEVVMIEYRRGGRVRLGFHAAENENWEVDREEIRDRKDRAKDVIPSPVRLLPAP